MELEELQIYQASLRLGKQIWDEVIRWEYFSKSTIGKQLIRSVDSIAANISEGFGRFHFKDSQKFNYYARGSLYETKTWLQIANNRNLIISENNTKYLKQIKDLGIKLNNYIMSTKNQYNTTK